MLQYNRITIQKYVLLLSIFKQLVHVNYAMKHHTIKKDYSLLIIHITNSLVAIAKFVKSITRDHVSTDQSHGRI